MADLFKALKPKATLSKNGFDLSRKHVFSSKAGQCLPCLAVETVPGDYHEIDVTAITRTRTMNTAAFMRGKMRYDFFFVPYSQLWHPFNQFITQRTDKHSTQQLGHIYAPVVALSTILYHIIQEINNETTDVHDFSYAQGMIRILDLLGYGDFRWLYNVQDLSDTQVIDAVIYDYTDKYVNVFRLAAYQHIWYDYYRNKYYDTVESGGITAFDSDLLPNDYIYGFNFDDLNCSTFANSVIGGSDFVSGQPIGDGIRLRMLLKMNYIQWKKDLFTSALPSQQFGAVSSVDISRINMYMDSPSSNPNLNVISARNDGLVRRSSIDPSNNPASVTSSSNSTFSIPSAFDVLSLRKAEALQQWKQNTLRAGNMTDDSFKAHFGVEPYYDSDENVNYLGSVSAALQINSVETTAASSSEVNGQVGDLAATGTIVVKGNKVQFKARDYGVLMCISSFLPESEYSSNCIDKANTLHEQFDWFTPEFQNIGLEPVTMFQQNIGGVTDLDADYNHVLGYAPRYYMYKQAVDKVFGEFKETESSLISTEADSFAKASGSYAAWVSPRKEYIIGPSRDLATFYVSPSIYDNVFAVVADSSQNTDSFINNVFFDIKSIRPMSVLGLPQF